MLGESLPERIAPELAGRRPIDKPDLGSTRMRVRRPFGEHPEERHALSARRDRMKARLRQQRIGTERRVHRQNYVIFVFYSLPLLMGEMRRAVAREEAERRLQDRFASTVVIAAAIIAAVRLARDADIAKPSPRLFAVISDSVALARQILRRVVGQ
jgi:hypothetical protein